MGGASGAIVVEGIQNYFPQVAGLPEQILVVRDQPFPSSAPTPTAAAPTPTPVATPTFTPVPNCSGAATPAPTPSPVCSGASNDLSLNFIDIGCPETPAVIQMQGAAPQLWRVVNASGDDIVDLQVVYDGEPQPLQVVAFDGVPVNSQDGATSAPPPEPVAATDILLAPGNRAEFLITPPAPGTDARLVTLPVNDGSQGANFPERLLLSFRSFVLSAAERSGDHSADRNRPAGDCRVSAAWQRLRLRPRAKYISRKISLPTLRIFLIST
jgi:hypothetical protein